MVAVFPAVEGEGDEKALKMVSLNCCISVGLFGCFFFVLFIQFFICMFLDMCFLSLFGCVFCLPLMVILLYQYYGCVSFFCPFTELPISFIYFDC